MLETSPTRTLPLTDPAEPTHPAIPNIYGEDISGMIYAAVDAVGVYVEALLAMMIAESALNPMAERWGKRTREAMIALGKENENWRELQAIVDDAWPDISFGYTQQIVMYHWWGDGTIDLNNILSVRKATFANPARDILEASYKLSSCIGIAGGDIMEGLMVYNFGHVVPPSKRGTTFWAHYASYESALAKAQAILSSGGGVV